jgi:uncharacterized protein (DUF885 family)
MKNILVLLLGLGVLTACNNQNSTNEAPVEAAASAQTEAPALSPEEETAKLNEWFEAKYEEELMDSPITLTSVGRKERYDEIDDLSEEEYKRQVDWKAATVEEMQSSFDYNNLTADGKISWDLWVYQNEQMQERYKWRKKNYVFHQMTGFHSYLPTFMISFHKVESESDMEAYVKRLQAVGRAINQLVDAAKRNAEAGTRPPRFAYEIVADQARKILTGQPFTEGEDDAPLFADAKTKIQGLVDAGTIEQARADELTQAAKDALLGSVKDGYENLIGFIEDDIGFTSQQAQGVSALPDGEAFYNHRLKMMTTTDLTADEIHEIGLSEVARLRGLMEEVKERSGFEGDLQEFFAFLRDSKDDPRFYYENNDAGAQAYIDDATAAIENIKAELPNYFGILPKADLVVKRVESFREQDGAPQHYFAGTPDGSRPGIYYAHLSDMEAMPITELEVIAYHEGLPGHPMPISIQQELTGVPTFRTQAGFTAYSEGWGLYSELLAKEMPNTYTNVYSEFGRLTSEIWRAIRLVVDTGLHAKGWTQEQAVEYFAENASTPRPAIEAEVRRYLVLPGQATAYKIGMIEIQRLRALAEQELGDDFDIRKFHDVILGGGAMPLALLERQVSNWISAAKGN